MSAGDADTHYAYAPVCVSFECVSFNPGPAGVPGGVDARLATRCGLAPDPEADAGGDAAPEQAAVGDEEERLPLLEVEVPQTVLRVLQGWADVRG